jgi:UDP-N-acetylmuramate dehydrogenase
LLAVPEPRTGVPLAPLTTLRLGGPAARLDEVTDEAALVACVGAADASGEDVLLLAGGSNVVIADAGFPGRVVQVRTSGVTFEQRAGDVVRLTVQAGEPWDALVARAVADGLAGIECLAGIPGSAGATPIQNVGAYGQEVAATIAAVRVLDRETGTIEDLPPERCGFRYRTSVFKGSGRHVVLAVAFDLERSAAACPLRYPELARALGAVPGDRPPLAEVREAVLGLRRAKGMVLDPEDHDTWSAGSFFTNPVLTPDQHERFLDRVRERLGPEASPPGFPEDAGVKLSAAWLIEHAGFRRGRRWGAVGLSDKHALALTNRGGATTAELLGAAREIAGGVAAAFGVALRPEPVLVGASWDAPRSV